MQKITPCLWFDDKAEEAVNFYTSISKNSTIKGISRYGEAGAEASGRPKGTVMTVTFQLDGQEFMALNGGPHFTFSPAISFIVNCETQQEVDELWEKLSAGGEKEHCGWLKDKYGVSWQIVPIVLGEMLQDKDPKRSERVMKAVLQMKRLDIQTLERAYESIRETRILWTAERFVKRLKAYRSPEQIKQYGRYFKPGKGDYGDGDVFIGVRMQVFDLAKEFIEMPPSEIEKLLESPIHEVRVGALSIMDKQARSKKTPEGLRKELFDLYLRRTDRINNWDLVDVCAPSVIGGYLFDKPRGILYTLARSENTWERRAAIVSTAYFIRQGEVADVVKIAELLLNDKEDLIHKATGWTLRYAGDKDLQKLLSFLDQHADTMPRVALRYAIEHLDRGKRDHYLSIKKHPR
jgi:predicted 3-demethylubiquinone-9 3-methyltransferase (glyoxalase superfamily)/3-methyladenine DNA glycosylase AlkD